MIFGDGIIGRPKREVSPRVKPTVERKGHWERREYRPDLSHDPLRFSLMSFELNLCINPINYRGM